MWVAVSAGTNSVRAGLHCQTACPGRSWPASSKPRSPLGGPGLVLRRLVPLGPGQALLVVLQGRRVRLESLRALPQGAFQAVEVRHRFAVLLVQVAHLAPPQGDFALQLLPLGMVLGPG